MSRRKQSRPFKVQDDDDEDRVTGENVQKLSHHTNGNIVSQSQNGKNIFSVFVFIFSFPE